VTDAARDLTERLLPVDARPSEPPWMSEARTSARRFLDETGLPTGREEDWRYTPLREIVRGDHGDYLPAGSQPVTAPVEPAGLDRLVGDHGGPRIVFVNGRLAPELSTGTGATDGVTCVDLAALFADTSQRALSALVELLDAGPVDGFIALNSAAADDAAVVLVDPGVHAPQPIHVVHLAVPGAEATAVHPRTLVHAGTGSEVTVVESYLGWPGRILTNAATTIVVGEDASVRHHRIQREAAGAVHVGATTVRQAARSRIRMDSVALGADVARSALHLEFDGDGAEAELDGLYLTTGQQHHDQVVTVVHNSSHCSSKQLFKGVVGDHGRGSFGGRIEVDPGTVGTEAHQTSRSLILGPDARVDSRPWLEISTDDVICTHGATVGRLDDDALFYLQTRGIPEAEATSMLIGAFVTEVVEAIPTDTVRTFLHDEITTKLDAMGVAG
jgi:Fe-S cluster assembly protein SufD